MMKKLFGLLCIFALFASALGCGELTTSTEKDNYSLGEKIEVYDKESASFLGEATVTNVRVLSTTPYWDEEYLCERSSLSPAQLAYGDRLVYKDENVYLRTQYKAIIQIDYKAQTLDSSNKIDEDNFKVFDCNDHVADRYVEGDYKMLDTKDESFVVGLTEKGDLTINFFFHTTQETLCTITCKYDPSAGTYTVTQDTSPSHFCPDCNTSISTQDNYCRHCGKKLK